MTQEFRASVRKSLESVCRAITNRDKVMEGLADFTLAALRDANAMRREINVLREHLRFPPAAWPERRPGAGAAQEGGEG
ncbi:MAG: hypothetical protein IRZ13_16870 [Acetobacteraceae bacterium]|nr:hypothetical protein [Acetobacteraceae bacterium]